MDGDDSCNYHSSLRRLVKGDLPDIDSVSSFNLHFNRIFSDNLAKSAINL